MKKVLDFLEQHVQWLAILLGGLYLGFMAWTFVINSPVSVKLGDQVLGPGEIDKEILDKPVQVLTAKLGRSSEIKLPPITWAEDFKNAMDLNHTKVAELSGKPWVDVVTVPTSLSQGPVVGPNTSDPIKELPVVPAAIMGPLASGASNVATPTAPGGVDKNWAVATFKIPNKEIASAFAAIKLPKILYTSTAVLDVTLMREEQKSDGSWGNPTTIAHLPTTALLPLPSKEAKLDEKRNFLAWAAPHQTDILQPTFYQWLKGDPINIPVAGAPAVAMPEPANPQAGLPDFDPQRTEYTIEEIRQMTPEQKRAWQKAVKEKEEKQRKYRAGKRGGSGPSGGRGKSGGAQGGGPRSVDDTDRPAIDLPDDVRDPFAPAADEHSGLSPLYPKYLRQDRGGGGGMPMHGGPPQPGDGQPGNGQPAAAPAEHPCPAGFFDPSESPEFWEAWAFDETVQAGKTYRYRVVYALKNPLFNSNAAEKDLTETLAIASTVSEWSEPVKIAARTSFYITANFADSAPSVKFQVFAWQGGAKREKTFEFSPGDMIGAMDNNVDFSTGSTLVDIGFDTRTNRAFALIVDNAGNLFRRDFASDKANPEWENDKRAVALGSAPPAPLAENR
ncbi:hypothetical protein BH09PLA1_BH09PLA1_36810 [soil metagenome]